MRLKDVFTECDYRGLRPVIPFFPFPRRDRPEALDFLARLLENLPDGAVGLAHPGMPDFPADAAAPEAAGEAAAEWDVFQFVYALKHRTGAPVVLALHYGDLLRFGIIPYGQEGHKVGLDALLVRDPLPEELDYFSAELAAHGVGLAAWLRAGLPAADARTLCGYATAFAYAEEGFDPGPARAGESSPRMFWEAQGAPAPVADLPADGRSGWLLPVTIGTGSPGGWTGLDPAALAAAIDAWMRTPLRIIRGHPRASVVK
jgi:hypothetical protein